MSTTDAPVSLFDHSQQSLAELLEGEPAYRVDQVWQGLYQQHATLDDLTNVPKSLRATLADQAPHALSPVTRLEADKGKTVKWLWQLHDGHKIESVLMYYSRWATLCLSSQAGCAMACGFCATGQAGFDRHLTTGEIVEQYIRAARESTQRVSNVVFMGMGEPLANLDQTWGAVERLHADIGLSARSITISTVGLVPGIRRLAERPLPVTLAVSLHAANDELRSELVPINRRYPLDELMGAIDEYRRHHNRRISFEWAMIDGVNDRRRDALELAALARRARAHINLIPLNRTPGYPTQGSTRKAIADFCAVLEDKGANATVRNTRGSDIDAACGQLAARLDHEAGAPAAAPVTIRPK